MEYSIVAQRCCHADTPWLDQYKDDWWYHPLASHYVTLAYCACCELHAFKEMPEFMRLFKCHGECH